MLGVRTVAVFFDEKINNLRMRRADDDDDDDDYGDDDNVYDVMRIRIMVLW